MLHQTCCVRILYLKPNMHINSCLVGFKTSGDTVGLRISQSSLKILSDRFGWQVLALAASYRMDNVSIGTKL